jgi:glycosyltransferase involved in cell wall biosynthesis
VKILLAAARFTPLLGGVETHAREIALRLNREFDVVVVTASPGKSFPLTDSIDGVAIRRVPTLPARGDPFIPRGWVRTLKEIQPEIVILDGYQSVISAWVLITTIRRNIPLIVAFHEGANANRLRQRLYPLQRRILGRWLRRANFTVAVAPHEVALYCAQLRLDPTRLKYIPNGSDMPQPAELPTVDPWHLVSIGRLEPQKRHNAVIDALAHLRSPESPWRLTVIGRGDEQPILERQAQALGLGDVVTFCSFAVEEREQMSSTLLSASIVIAPSLFETHPIAVIEAAALGCHVLVPAEGNEGVLGLVARGIVEAIPTLDPKTFAEGIRQASKKVFTCNREELLSWDDAASEFVSLINQIASEKQN